MQSEGVSVSRFDCNKTERAAMVFAMRSNVDLYAPEREWESQQ